MCPWITYNCWILCLSCVFVLLFPPPPPPGHPNLFIFLVRTYPRYFPHLQNMHQKETCFSRLASYKHDDPQPQIELSFRVACVAVRIIFQVRTQNAENMCFFKQTWWAIRDVIFMKPVRSLRREAAAASQEESLCPGVALFYACSIAE